MTWVATEPVVKAGTEDHFLYDVADAIAPHISEAFREAVAGLGEISTEKLLEALEAGEAGKALDLFDFTAFDARLRKAWGYWLWRGLSDAGVETELRLGPIRKQEEDEFFSFAGSNPRAVSWAAEHAAELVVEVSEETQAALRQTITAGIKGQKHPFTLMRDVQNIIGLNSRQARAVINYQNRLIEMGLSPERIDDLTAKYIERQHKWRGENISRTESMNAACEGQRESWRQLAEQGYVNESDAERKWIMGSVDRSCPVCRGLAGKRAPINGSYPDGTSGPPKHPSCRCVEGLVYRDKTVGPRKEPGPEKRYAKDGVPRWSKAPADKKEFRDRSKEWAKRMSEVHSEGNYHFKGRITKKRIPESGIARWDGNIDINSWMDDYFEMWILHPEQVRISTASGTVETYLHEFLHMMMRSRDRSQYSGPWKKLEEGFNEALTKRMYKRFVKDLALDKIDPAILDYKTNTIYDNIVRDVESLARYITRNSDMSSLEFIETIHAVGMDVATRIDAIVDIIKGNFGLKATESPRGMMSLKTRVSAVLVELGNQTGFNEQMRALKDFIEQLRHWHE